MSTPTPGTRRHPNATVALLALIAASTGCVAEPDVEEEMEPVSEHADEVVYGVVDDRQDVYAHSDASLRRLAEESTVALIDKVHLNEADPSNITYPLYPLGVWELLCPTERFLFDPTIAKCSGTLIDDDLVLTAAHCAPDAAGCAGTKVVFNFYRDTALSLETITSSDVFSCSSIVASEWSRDSQGNPVYPFRDYTIMRLDRAAVPRFTPAPVRQDRSALSAGRRVGLASTTSGIPLKIDSAGRVIDSGAPDLNVFMATTDTFEYSSGAGVYDLDTYSVAANFMLGENDYDLVGGCQIVNKCLDNGTDCSGEWSAYVHHALDGLCAAEPSNRLCSPSNTFSFSASGTASAVTNTVNHFVALKPGQTITLGTCGLDGAAGAGDTLVRLVDPAGTIVASDDDGCAGSLSKLTYTVPPLLGGLYQIRAGCYLNHSCSGSVAYSIRGDSGSFSYSASGTNSATVNTVNQVVTLSTGQTIFLGTCGVAGASGKGDTYLRLFSPSGVEVSSSNDTCGKLSKLAYTVPPGGKGEYVIRAGCYLNQNCSGTVAYTVSGGNPLAYSASSTNNATVNTVSRILRLEPGQTLTAGTCGVTGASGTGNTYLRLYSPSGVNVVSNNDACGGTLSNLSYLVPAGAGGEYEIRAGCSSNLSCTGMVAYTIATSSSFLFTESSTSDATMNTTDQFLTLKPGQTITAGTCSATGGSGTGDTFLRLFDPASQNVVSDDDTCGGGLSKLTYTVPANGGGSYQIRAGCYGNESCQGKVGLSVSGN